jgi:hypothetical protein
MLGTTAGGTKMKLNTVYQIGRTALKFYEAKKGINQGLRPMSTKSLLDTLPCSVLY